MIDSIKRIFWFCFTLFMFYISIELLRTTTEYQKVKHAVSNIIEEDMDAVQDMVSGTASVDPTNGRVKYPNYDWFYDYANVIESYQHYYLFAMDVSDTITWASNGRCINVDEEAYFRSQFKSIVEVFIYEELPRDKLTATDAQIDAATKWKDVEMQNLIKPIINC